MTTNHHGDPIPPDSGSTIHGNSRNWGDASTTLKGDVADQIVSVAVNQYHLDNNQIANLLAFAQVESGFNPDAATPSAVSSASGVFQITDTSAADATSRLNGSSIIGGHQFTSAFNRFDIDSNIEYGIAIYLDK